MAYGKLKDLTKRTEPDKVLRIKAFEIERNPKYDGYQRGLASMVYKLFDQISIGRGAATVPNSHPTNELHKQIIRKFKRSKNYSSLTGNI